MRYPENKPHQEQGFTIVELMIATTVLATILVLLTVMMLSIGKLYYKGLNQARVQDSVRSIVDDVSQQLQLSGATPHTSTTSISGVTMNAYCIGTTRYSYAIGRQIGSGNDTNSDGTTTPQIAHVLWRDTNTSGNCDPLNLTQDDPTAGAPAGTSAHGSELVPPNSRLTNFSISDSSPYAVSIEVAYGNSDLLSGTNGPAGSVVCRGGNGGASGDQYCATASLITTVVQRL